MRYAEPLERAVATLEPLFEKAPIAPRALSLMALSRDETLTDWLRRRLDERSLAVIETVRETLERAFHEPIACVINGARLAEARRVARAATLRNGNGAPHAVARRLDALATHKEQAQLRKEDAEVLGELIERGKKSGAAELEITLTKEQHAGLRGKLAEPKSGISAELLAGGQGEGQYKLRVRYK